MTDTSNLTTSSFLDMIGVCTHLSYTDGGYANVANVISDLKYLGVTHVRDSLAVASHLPSYEAVAKQGISFTLTMKGQTQTSATLGASLNLVGQMLADVPGSVKAVEGLNEVNKWAATYNGIGGIDGAVGFQQALYAAVHGDTRFRGVAVDYFTGAGVGAIGQGPDPSKAAGLADFANQHPYPSKGQAPGAYIDPNAALNYETKGQTGAFVYTETGYSSNGGTGGAVNTDVQARYTLDLLFDAALSGASQVDLYDLLDAYAPGSAQGDDGFGLFDSDNKPKPVATAIHNMNAILSAPGATASSAAGARAFAPTVAGLPSTGRSLVLQKSAGTSDLVVWAEPQIWDRTTGTQVATATNAVTVDLGARYASVSVFDPLLGTAPVAVYANASSVSLGVTDHPLIIEVSGAAAAAVPMTAAAALATAGRGLLVSDTAAGVAAALAGLEGRGADIASIAVTGGPLTVGAAAYKAYGGALHKVAGGFAVSDTGASIASALGSLAADASVTAITVQSGKVDVSAATFVADRAALDRIAGGFTITDTSSNIAAAADAIAADAHKSAVTAVDGGLVSAQKLFNADGSLNSASVTTRDGLGNVTTRVSAGSALAGKGYAAYDEVRSASGKLLSRTTYAASGAPLGRTTYNADGSVLSSATMTAGANGDTLTHTSGGTILKGKPYSSYDTDVSAGGTTLYTEYTYGNNASHAFEVGSDGAVLSANYNDSFHVTGHGETFVFQHGFGAATIDGWSGGDAIVMSHNLFRDFADVLHRASGTANTTLTDGRGDTLTLVGLAPDHLSSSMFKFV